MAARVGEEEKASENQQKEREADNGEVAPVVIVESLRRFRVVLIGLIQQLPKWPRLRREGSLKS